ncbi:MAG: dephospho-CoA kinase [bacterium]|nr:dephospho-CoA kinase [bacterium]
MLKVVGLTGGIASGKDTVAVMFADLGAEIIDADKIANDLINARINRNNVPAKIVGFFGRDILNNSGRIDKKRLADIVFKDRKKLEYLNRIMHPEIIKIIKEKIASATPRNDEGNVTIINAPLIVEAEATSLVDKLIVVSVGMENQIARLRARSSLTREEACRRINAQLSIKEKERFSDFIIDNNNGLEETEKQVKKIWKELCT